MLYTFGCLKRESELYKGVLTHESQFYPFNMPELAQHQFHNIIVKVNWARIIL
jgi:hypothetical protein